MLKTLKNKMKIDKDNISEISNKLLSGAVSVMPSDTVYGFFACALNPAAVERIYSIKKRDLDKPFIVLISDIKDLELFGIEISSFQSRVVNKYWPGPLSLVFSCKNPSFEYLHRGTNSLAIRMPNDEWLSDIFRKTGPLVAPSANIQNAPTVKNTDEAIETFGNSVDFYVDGGEIAGVPSTLAKFNGDKLEILRLGGFIVHGQL